MKRVIRISTGDILYQQDSDFETGKGILNARTMFPSIPIEDMQETDEISSNTLSYLKSLKLNALKAYTRNNITSDSPNEKRMPEWRCLKWTRYADMYEKKAGGGTLTARETAEYNSMIAVGETALSVYNDVLAAINWIQGCITANDAMEAQIEACTTKAQLDAIDVARCPYPAWEGWGIAKAYINPSP